MYSSLVTNPGLCAPLLLIAFILAIIFSLGILQHNRFSYCLMETARNLGLKYEDAGFFYPPKLRGVYRNREVSVYCFTKHTGDHSARYTRVEAAHKGNISGVISITRENIMTTLGKKFGVQDIHVVNKIFDNEFFVRASNEEEVKRLLDDGLQRILLETKMQVDVTKNNAVHEKQGYITDKKYLRKALDVVVDVAERADKL